MLSDDIRYLTERALWETENLDRWYINPCDADYTNPEFHTDTLADLNVVPKEEERLTRTQLEGYFERIREKIQNYIAELEDPMLCENPENCDKSRFRLILGQFRHWHRHMGVIYGFIIEDTGKWPYVLNMCNAYPDSPLPNFY